MGPGGHAAIGGHGDIGASVKDRALIAVVSSPLPAKMTIAGFRVQGSGFRISGLGFAV